MRPLIRSKLPPEPPESIHSHGSDKTTSPASDGDRARHGPDHIYLPHRDVCQRYAMRFFEEIQSIYWFYSPEQFYTLVDKTYADHGRTSTPSWLCSLYSIFAICAVKEESASMESLHAFATKSSSEYLAMAKSFGVQVCDEATTDAVRALSLMSLALHSTCFTVTAYLITGMTVRMAYTLGLHRNISPNHIDSVSRARVHRLWWTIYLLDQEVAIQLGYPCAIIDNIAGIQTPPASESILDPGPGTPHGYQACCVSLIKLKKKISHTLYVAPALSSRRVVPFSAVTTCLSDLHAWFSHLPSHLSWGTGTAPSHRRAIAVLHLRYWTTFIHIQRPFLLDTAIRSSSSSLPLSKKHHYEELSHSCLSSALSAITIVKRMREHRLLSSLVLFDVQSIQELVYVFMLAQGCYAGTKRGEAAAEGLAAGMDAMRGMERVGWRERILPETEAQVAARGGVGVARRDAFGGVGGGRDRSGDKEDAEGDEDDEKEGRKEGMGDREDRGVVDQGGVAWSGELAPFQPMEDSDALNDAFFENFQDTDW